MIYLASDMHGIITDALEEYKRNAEESDLLIILGDLGMWFENTEDNEGFTQYMLSYPKKVALVDGNHENHEKINSFPIEIWNKGRVHRISENIVHLMRGEIFEINGKSFFAIGGCASSQKWINAGKPWYAGENPTEDEIIYAKENLKKHSNSVNYILTHKYLHEVSLTESQNSLEGLIHYLKSNVKYNAWYFGHDHIDMPLDEKHFCVYDILKKIK